ncbi:MAG: hypothetical protein KKA60_11975 [Proteobacteria bacterium]|nr:hypothetical protein [Pseudomonadota bacterium]
MHTDILDSMDKTELRRYLEFLLWHYRVVDSFWFIEVDRLYGQSAAEKINEEVWARTAPMAARDLLSRFEIREKGLEGFSRLLSLYTWTILIGYHMEMKEDGLLLTVPSCPTQEARKKRGLSEYACREMHRREFEGLASVVDERIRVQCLFAPPDPHPQDTYCQWRFFLSD